ncbi:MAG: outer membrane protein assembly factor BamD [Bacteroidia bacterium]|jgi:outer membrane protein assembly factor BamD
MKIRLTPSKMGKIPRFWLLGGLLLVLTLSCDSYNKILKNPNLNFKFQKAREFYLQGEYFKAQPLLEELVSAYRGSDLSEGIYYYYAYCDFQMGAYQTAAYHFKQFNQLFPSSPKGEEMDFMYAYCMYMDSPGSNLDQTNSQRAIEGLQLFVNKYPNSPRLEQCNRMIEGLRNKMRVKALESALLFYRMEDYRASAVTLQHLLIEYPDLEEREKIRWMVVESYYKLATNSIESKKATRFESVLEAHQALSEEYPQSLYLPQSRLFAEEARAYLASPKASNSSLGTFSTHHSTIFAFSPF